jgi:lipid-binding SYLF domain-containing protein
MTLKFTLRSVIAVSVIGAFLFAAQASYAQAAKPPLLETASRRSQNAAKTIKVITAMPEDEALPAELWKRAKAIGVFPDVVKMSLMFSQAMKAYGVICSRQPEGWSLPAYYGFGSSEMNLKIASFKSFDLVILFMNENTVKWFQKGALEFKGIRSGVAGPIGKLTREAENELQGANIILYALVDGKLRGINLESNSWTIVAGVNPDNNINKAVYGIKGREVLEGKAPKTTSNVSDVTAFRDILNEKFPK